MLGKFDVFRTIKTTKSFSLRELKNIINVLNSSKNTFALSLQECLPKLARLHSAKVSAVQNIGEKKVCILCIRNIDKTLFICLCLKNELSSDVRKSRRIYAAAFFGNCLLCQSRRFERCKCQFSKLILKRHIIFSGLNLRCIDWIHQSEIDQISKSQPIKSP